MVTWAIDGVTWIIDGVTWTIHGVTQTIVTFMKRKPYIQEVFALEKLCWWLLKYHEIPCICNKETYFIYSLFDYFYHKKLSAENGLSHPILGIQCYLPVFLNVSI
jgi:hypothetical protein